MSKIASSPRLSPPPRFRLSSSSPQPLTFCACLNRLYQWKVHFAHSDERKFKYLFLSICRCRVRAEFRGLMRNTIPHHLLPPPISPIQTKFYVGVRDSGQSKALGLSLPHPCLSP